MKEKHENLQFDCTMCSETFDNMLYLEKHKTAKHLRMSVQFCNVCDVSFENQEQLEFHQTKTNHKLPSNTTPVPSTIWVKPPYQKVKSQNVNPKSMGNSEGIFSSNSKELEETKNKTGLEQENSIFETSSIADDIEHLSNQNSEEFYIPKSPKNLVATPAQFSPQSELTCEICSLFSTDIELELHFHLAMVHDFCVFCKESWPFHFKVENSGIQYHLKNVHDYEIFYCKQCRFVTLSQDCLTEHENTHEITLDSLGFSGDFQGDACSEAFGGNGMFDIENLSNQDGDEMSFPKSKENSVGNISTNSKELEETKNKTGLEQENSSFETSNRDDDIEHLSHQNSQEIFSPKSPANSAANISTNSKELEETKSKTGLEQENLSFEASNDIENLSNQNSEEINSPKSPEKKGKNTEKEQKAYGCYLCQAVFQVKFSAKSHFLQKHDQEVYNHKKIVQLKFNCPECQNSFEIFSELKSHFSEMHQGVLELEKVYLNDLNSAASLFKRKTKSTKDEKVTKKVECDSCNAVLSSEQKLKRHKKTKHGDRKMFNCTRPSEKNPKVMCKASFPRSDSLLKHVRNVHDKNRPFSCPHCDKTFPDDFSLKRHRCTGEGKPFKCSICDKAYSQKGKLAEHISKEHK